MVVPIPGQDDPWVALAELLPLVIYQQPDVGEPWRPPPKGVVQLDMPGGGNEPLLLRGVSLHILEYQTRPDTTRTAPRTTCVICMRWSSTTLARWYVGKPSLLRMMKSLSGSALANRP